MRGTAALLGLMLTGGLATIGFLDAGRGGATVTGALSLRAGAVATVARPGGAAGADGAATAMPQLAGQPAQALMPADAASRRGSATSARRTASAAGHSASPSASPAAASASPTQAASPSQSAPASAPVAAGATCTTPSFTTSAQFGTWDVSPYSVANNMWNIGGDNVSQTLHACSYSNWYVTASVGGGNGSVKTYPNSHLNFGTPQKISSLRSVTSTFAETSPGTGTYEDAYDIWLNGIANPGAGSDEVMIWTENHGQVPGGSPTGTVTFGGRSYTAWKGTGNYMAFVANSNFTSGTLNLLAFFQWIIAKGWVPASSTLNQVDYGVELVSTNSTPTTFTFSNFSVSAS